MGFLPLFAHRGEQGEQARRKEKLRKADPAAHQRLYLVPSKAGAFQQRCCYLFISYVLYLCEGKA